MDGVQHTIAIAGEVLSSWLALRLYVLCAGAALIAACFWFARQQHGEMLKPRAFAGRKPQKEKSVVTRLIYHREERKSALLALRWNFFNLLLFGFVAPSVLLALGFYFYDWFRPGHVALTATLGGVTRSATLPEIAVFLLSQMAMGVQEYAVAGASLIGLGLSGMGQRLEPTDGGIALGVMAYRYFIGGFVTMLVHLGWSIWRMARDPGEHIKQLEEKLVSLRTGR